MHSTVQDVAPSGANRATQSFTITEVDASEYEPQVVELPPSPPSGAGEQEGCGGEEDDRGKEEAESQNNEGVRHVSMCKPMC